MTDKWANLVFDLLVKEAGAAERERDSFLDYLLRDNEHKEYRFCGCFGLGGKFYRTSFDWRVSYYQEDHNEERATKKEQINNLLRTMRAKFLNGVENANTQNSTS